MKWLQNNKGKFLIIFSVLAVIIIHILFSCHAPNDWWEAKWEAGDILTYLGTILLGWLAIWQNEELKKTNEISQARLERISEKANDINVISKIIEYELDKKRQLEEAFENFELNCNPQRYSRALIDDGDIKVEEQTIILEEMELDEAYLKICDKLGIYPDEKRDRQIDKEVEKLYYETKELIQCIKDKKFSEIESSIDKIKSARGRLGATKNSYLISKRAELDDLIRGDVELKNIKAIY